MSLSVSWLNLFLFSIFVTEALAVTSTNMITKPGCQSKCGDLTIPYPFGIGEDCFLDGNFGITCNTSQNPPKAFHVIFASLEILDITDTEVMVRNPLIFTKCYDSQGNETESPIPEPEIFETWGSSLTISHTSNKLTVIGCDDYALIDASRGTSSDEEEKYSMSRAGCFALCGKPDEAIPGSCMGTGCCQVDIPIGLQMVKLNLHSLNRRQNPTNRLADAQSCSSAFFAANDSFRFEGKTDLATIGVLVNRTLEKVPLVLDWALERSNSGNSRSCSQAKKNFCQSNTTCIDSDAGGYNCRCLEGYEGNPYLEPGCTDINECLLKDNKCSMICTNLPGNYSCSCPQGYVGNGWKTGSGCTKLQKQLSIILGLSISLGTILLTLGCWWLYTIIQKRKIIQQKATNFKRNGGWLLQQQMSSDENVMERMKIFTADELERATDNFREDRALGEGGQGTVYKGMLSDGKLVAIKKSKQTGDESHSMQFINELIILTRINHRNIVMLLGSCLETEVPLIVYEFIPNGTLFHHIHNANEEFPITWKMRLQIAHDSASALNYLHTLSSIPVFHRDMKSSNILLDEKYRAKLSDFGISKSVAIDQTHVTTGIMGTPGYLDPEYFQSSQYTEKSDVYSFGVVLVELLTGQKAIHTMLGEAKSLISWFLSHTENSRLLEVIDAQILQEGSNEEFLVIANIAVRCLNLDGKKRPTMREILREIESVQSQETLANPNK